MIAPSAWAQAAPEQAWIAQCADGSTRRISIPADAPVPEARDAAVETARPLGCDPVRWKRADEKPETKVVPEPKAAAEKNRPAAVERRPTRQRAKRRHPQRPWCSPIRCPRSTRRWCCCPCTGRPAAAHGVPWEVLAAIDDVETAYGDNVAVSSAGARGWMQFMPQTWRAYGVDADHDGAANPNAPADAIFAAARYLAAAGASTDLRAAVFAYNHADWYVDAVLERAAAITAMPDAVIVSLSGLATAGPPVAGAIAAGSLLPDGSVALRVPARAAAIAVADGVVERLGRTQALGRYVILRDDAGNRFTYSGLGRLARAYEPAGAAVVRRSKPAAVRAPDRRRRLYAHPTRRANWRAAGFHQLLETGVPMRATLTGRGAAQVTPPRAAGKVRRLRRGARLRAGTVIGSAARDGAGRAGQLRFAVRPAGGDAPAVDPRPLLRAWAVTRRSGAYRALASAAAPGTQAPRAELERRVLEDPAIQIYPCGREDIEAGRIDARVLATLSGLAAAGLRPTVSSLECGHSLLTRGGRISQHSSGNAVDIAAVNGVPIAGHQEPGGIAERTVRRLLAQRGELQPDQVISLLALGGASFAQDDHGDHIHVGFRPRAWTEQRATAGAASGERGLPPAAVWQSLLTRVEALPRASMAGDATVARRRTR